MSEAKHVEQYFYRHEKGKLSTKHGFGELMWGHALTAQKIHDLLNAWNGSSVLAPEGVYFSLDPKRIYE